MPPASPCFDFSAFPHFQLHPQRRSARLLQTQCCQEGSGYFGDFVTLRLAGGPTGWPASRSGPKMVAPCPAALAYEIDTDLLAIALEVDGLCHNAGLPPPPTFVPLPPGHIHPPRLPAMIHPRPLRPGRRTGLAGCRLGESPPQHRLPGGPLAGWAKPPWCSKWLLRMQAHQFRGAERFYGVSFYSQGSRGGGPGHRRPLHRPSPRMVRRPRSHPRLPWDRGARLAELISGQRTLLVLDGLEPLQSPPVPGNPGKLKDQALAGLLNGLALRQPGLMYHHHPGAGAGPGAFHPHRPGRGSGGPGSFP